MVRAMPFHATQPVLAAYGKLPIERDFVRLRSGGLGGQAIVSYLEAERHRYEEVDESAESTLLLWLANGNGVYAVIRPSSDQGGLRPWPFAFFAELGPGLKENLVDAPWSGLAPIRAALRDAHQRTRELSDAFSFDRVFRDHLLPTVEAQESSGRQGSAPMLAWAAELFGDSDDFAFACWRILAAMKAERSGRKVTGLRVPCSRAFDVAAQVDGWQSVMQRENDAILVAENPGNYHTITIFFGRCESGDLVPVSSRPSEGFLDLTVPNSAISLDGFGAFADGVQERMQSASLNQLKWVIVP